MKLREKVLTWVVIAVLLGAMAYSVFSAERASGRVVMAGVHDALKALVNEHGRTLSADMDARLNGLRGLAAGLGDAALPVDAAGRAALARVLSAATGDAFEWVGYAGADGLGVWSDGAALDVRDQAFYGRALAGERQVAWCAPRTEGGAYRVVLAQPIMADGALKALAVGVLSGEHMNGLLRFDIDDEDSYCFITDASGRILIETSDMDSRSIASNALDLYRDAVIESGAELAEIERGMTERGTVSFSYNYGNQHRYVTYAPLPINDWFVFGVIPSDWVSARFGNARALLPGLMAWVVACMAIVIALFGWRERRLTRMLRAANERADRGEKVRRAIEELSYTILFEVDPVTGAFSMNDAFEWHFGRKLLIDNLYNLSDSGAPSEDLNAWRKLADEMKRGMPKATASVQMRHQNGALLWYRVSYMSLYNGERDKPYRIVGRVANIERRDNENEVQDTRAGSDALTGLIGHRAFMEQAERMLGALRGRGGLLFVDIDGFKAARDPKNRFNGEQLIVHLSEKLRRLFGASALIGRLGGDTFAVLITDATDKDYVTKRANALCDAFDDIDDMPIGQERPTCSVGIAMAEDDVASMIELSRRADHALYSAKLAGKHCVVFFDSVTRPGGSGQSGGAAPRPPPPPPHPARPGGRPGAPRPGGRGPRPRERRDVGDVALDDRALDRATPGGHGRGAGRTGGLLPRRARVRA